MRTTVESSATPARNIDHLAVGPWGITVIDSKTYRGKIRRDWYGGLFVERRTILRIDGRDQTNLTSGVDKQIGYVHSALVKLDLDHELAVAGARESRPPALAPADRDPRDPPRRSKARRTSRRRSGPLDSETVERIWTHLGRAFTSA